MKAKRITASVFAVIVLLGVSAEARQYRVVHLQDDLFGVPQTESAPAAGTTPKLAPTKPTSRHRLVSHRHKKRKMKVVATNTRRGPLRAD